MAATIARYNHTLTLKNTGAIDWASLKLVLLTDGASFDPTDTSLDDVAGAADPSRPHEVFGNGWTEGGEDIENAAWSTVVADGDSIANDSMLDADDISVTATGGPIGPAHGGVIIDDSHEDKVPLYFIDFGDPQEAGQDTDFKVVWHANGIYRERDYPV